MTRLLEESEKKENILNRVHANAEGFTTVTYRYDNGLFDYVHFLNAGAEDHRERGDCLPLKPKTLSAI